LTAKKADNLRKPGFYGDGEGLNLKVGAGGTKSWMLLGVVDDRGRDLGLGSSSLTSLAEARTRGREATNPFLRGFDADIR